MMKNSSKEQGTLFQMFLCGGKFSLHLWIEKFTVRDMV